MSNPSGSLLAIPLVLVTAMSVVFVLILAAFPTLVFQNPVGAHFHTQVSGMNLADEDECAATGCIPSR